MKNLKKLSGIIIALTIGKNAFTGGVMKRISCKSIALINTETGFKRCELDVPFVPTPFEIVEKMLEIARLHPDDLLYDLGCGDGRIVITAARKFGSKGIGFDLDPNRIQDCHRNAVKASVEDKVKFVNQSFFDADLRNADVITLYLLSSVNLKIRSKLFDELEPGVRIVSHDFQMDKWKPDKEERTGDHSIFFWIMPANFSGTWNFSLPEDLGGKFSISIRQRFQKTIASLISPTGGSIKSCTVKGSVVDLRIQLHINDKYRPFRLNGVIKDDHVEGSVTTPGKPVFKWIALRKEGSMKPIY